MFCTGPYESADHVLLTAKVKFSREATGTCNTYVQYYLEQTCYHIRTQKLVTVQPKGFLQFLLTSPKICY